MSKKQNNKQTLRGFGELLVVLSVAVTVVPIVLENDLVATFLALPVAVFGAYILVSKFVK